MAKVSQRKLSECKKQKMTWCSNQQIFNFWWLTNVFSTWRKVGRKSRVLGRISNDLNQNSRWILVNYCAEFFNKKAKWQISKEWLQKYRAYQFFPKKRFFLSTNAHTFVFVTKAVRNVLFLKNLVCLVSLFPPFGNSPFYLIIDELLIFYYSLTTAA